MLRALAHKLRWSFLGAAGAALVLVTTTALAGSGVGDVFNLGENNTVDQQSQLTGTSNNNPQLRVENASTAGGSFGVLGKMTSSSAAADSAGVRGINAASGSNGSGVTGLHQGSGAGVLGTSGAGTGVVGKHTGTTGTNPGVRGETSSTAAGAAGVVGSSTDGEGVIGQSTTDAGVHGLSNTTGVLAQLTGSPPATSSALEALVSGHGQGIHVHPGGLFFSDAIGILIDGNLDVGIRASNGGPQASSTAGTIESTNANVSGRAVIGTAESDGGFGILGIGDANVFARGVVGQSVPGVGVEGKSDSGTGVLGRTKTGLAGKFEGNVHVIGKVTRAYTSGTSNQATPVAYGAVTSGGSIVTTASTPNVSSTFDSVNKRYVITITGESYDINHFATTVTPINTTPRFVATQSSGGKLLIRVFDLAGTAVQSPFMFVTYKP